MTEQKSANLAQDNAPARVSSSPAGASAKPAATEQQWQLALAHLSAGNAASSLLRALVFIAALALLAFVLSVLQAGSTGVRLWAHVLALLSCVGALAGTAKGFRLQSEQSMQRFRLIRDGNLEGLAQHDSVIEQLRGRQSAHWDRVAIWLLLAALLIEILARLFSPSAAINV